MPSGLRQGGGKSESGDSRHSLTIWTSFPSASSFWRSSDPPISRSLKKTKGGFVLPETWVCTGRWWNENRKGVDWYGLHWGVRHKTLTHMKLHGIALISAANLCRFFDYVKADFCSDFHDFLVTDVILVILANGIWDSPVLKPSFKRHGACHVSQSLILLRIILVISAISADGIWDELSLVPDPLVHIHHQWIWVQDACLLAALKSQQMFLQFRQIAIWYNAETWVMWYMQTNS